MKMMSLLGGALQMSPEFFEEHLINSGWSGSNYGDFEATIRTLEALLRITHGDDLTAQRYSHYCRQIGYRK